MASSCSTAREEAHSAVNTYLKKGGGKKHMLDAYNATSDKYDEYMVAADYFGPKQIGKTMSELFPSNRDEVKMLDVGCGTGLSGKEMWKVGFRHIDGVDPSQSILDQAKDKRVYEQLFCEYVEANHQLDAPDNTYDVATLVGTMAENHLPSGAFFEIVRLVKPGGLVVNITRLENLSVVEEYKNNLTRCFRELEDAGKWKEESRTSFPNFVMGKPGVVLTHRVL